MCRNKFFIRALALPLAKIIVESMTLINFSQPVFMTHSILPAYDANRLVSCAAVCTPAPMDNFSSRRDGMILLRAAHAPLAFFCRRGRCRINFMMGGLILCGSTAYQTVLFI
jgi:hypothetical protein